MYTQPVKDKIPIGTARMDDSMPARGRPRTFDPDVALDKIVHALRRDGIDAVSLNDLAREAGAAKPALYAAFGDKDAVLARALQRYYEVNGREAEAALDDGSDLRSALRGYLYTLIDQFTDPRAPDGCLLVSSTISCAHMEANALKHAVDDLNERSFGALVDRIAQAMDGGELSRKADPIEIAQFVSGQAVALSVLARTGGDRAQLRKFADNALHVIDQWLS